MKRNKINIDRPIVSSEEINKRQDFTTVMKGVKKMKPPLYKNPWFYGPVGLASLALLFTLSIKEEQFEEKTTFTKENEIISLLEDTECIHKPIKNLKEASEVFYVHPSKEKTVQLSTGTAITFPEGSLIVSGEQDSVKIEIKEYQDKSSVFLSGITMDKGADSAFESAGMIDISGTLNGKPCSINSDKPIQIGMVLTKNPDNFPFWKLDTLIKDWVEYPVQYSEYIAVNNDLDQFKKKEVQLKSEIVNLEKVILDNKINYSKVKEPNIVDYKLPKLGNQQFDLDFDSGDFPELKNFKGMNFEVFTDKEYDKSFTKKTWSDVSLEKADSKYFAIFKSNKEVFKIQVRPVLTSSDKVLAENKFEAAIQESKQIKKVLEDERKITEKQLVKSKKRLGDLVKSFKVQTSQELSDELLARKGVRVVRASDFVATFTITNFGTYNCDKVNKYPRVFDRDFIYSYNGSSSTQIKNAYVFDQEKNVRFSYGINCKRPVGNLGFFKDNESILVTIDAEGNLGYVLKLDEFSFEKDMLKITKVNKKDVNLSFIQKLLSETPAET